MIGADRRSCGISEHAVYSQDEVDNRITTSSASECISVGSSSIVLRSVPGIWQLICTNCCSCSISEHTVYRQDEVNNGITTASANECISVSARGGNIGAIPSVWQLISTNSSSDCISENAVYSQDEVGNGITATSASERISVSASGSNVSAIPAVW